MNIELTDHAKERMLQYFISESQILQALENPDMVTETYGGRALYQKKLNGYILRIVVEEGEGIKIVITLYKARSGRYEI